MWHELKSWQYTYTDAEDMRKCIAALEKYGWVEDCPLETRWTWTGLGGIRCELTFADQTFRFYVKEQQPC